MPEEEVVLGPAKEVLDDQEKVQVPEREQQQAPAQRASPARRIRFLRSLNVAQLISLYNEDAAGAPVNEAARQEILELILEKGGPGAVRRALGRLMAMADGHAGRPAGAADSGAGATGEGGGANGEGGAPARDPLDALRGRLGHAFVSSLLRDWHQQLEPSSPGAAADPAPASARDLWCALVDALYAVTAASSEAP